MVYLLQVESEYTRSLMMKGGLSMATPEERFTAIEKTLVAHSEDINDLKHHVTMTEGMLWKAEADIREIKNIARSTESRIILFEATVDARFNDHDKRFQALENRLTSVEGRLTSFEENVNQRFEAIDKRFEAQDKKFDHMLQLLTSIVNKIGPVEPQA